MLAGASKGRECFYKFPFSFSVSPWSDSIIVCWAAGGDLGNAWFELDSFLAL